MLLSLFLLLLALSPSSQEICSAPGALPAPTLYLSQMSDRPEGSMRLQCSITSGAQATRIIFCKDGEEASSQPGSLGKLTYDFDHVVSRSSSGNYSCGYEIKGSDNQVNRSQLSPAQHLSVTGTLPAPTFHLNRTLAQPGDSVWLQCSIESWVQATRIIFYKDGEEVSSQTGLKEKVTYNYDHLVSRGSSGSYACGYEIKDSDSRVISPAQHLNVTGLDLKLLLGIAVPAAVLVLAVVLYLLGRKALSPSSQEISSAPGNVTSSPTTPAHPLPVESPTDQREEVPHDTSNAPEDEIQYACVTWRQSAKPQTDERL